MKVYDAKNLSQKILDKTKKEIEEITNKVEMLVKPSVVILQANSDNASNLYVGNKIKKCTEVGIIPLHNKYEEDISTEEMIEIIESYNSNPSVHAILVQLPLYDHLNEKEILEAISPKKDVDSLTTQSLGYLYDNFMEYLPLTPKGIMKILEDESIEIEGKNAVVLGRSVITGKSMALGLLDKNATVTICHSKTKNLKKVCKQADILVCCMGKQMIDSSYVKDGAVVLNIGYDVDKNGKTCGDIFLEDIIENSKASFVTKIFNCSGLMTTTILTERVLELYKEQINSKIDFSTWVTLVEERLRIDNGVKYTL